MFVSHSVDPRIAPWHCPFADFDIGRVIDVSAGNTSLHVLTESGFVYVLEMGSSTDPVSKMVEYDPSSYATTVPGKRLKPLRLMEEYFSWRMLAVERDLL